MEYHRKQAKALRRAHRAGERDAVERAEAVLGARARERFRLSDAQYVVAREAGHRTWAELRRAAAAERPADRAAAIRAALQAAEGGWGGHGEAVLDAGMAYTDGDPVLVRVRKRGRNYDIDDGGGAVQRAGRPPGWLDAARHVVEEYALNVNRGGVVFVPAFEGGLDRAWLAGRIAEASLALYEELLELAAE